MSFEEMLRNSGGFKGLFAQIRSRGLSVEAELETFLRNESGLFSLARFSVKKVDDGYAEITFPFSKEVARHGGIVHGGIISFALDNVGGIAVMTNNTGIDQVTLELKINFLEPLKVEPFTAKGFVLRHGRITTVAEAEMRDGDGKLCAKALGTWYTIHSH
jgi:acyl-CoA thioesterase